MHSFFFQSHWRQNTKLHASLYFLKYQLILEIFTKEERDALRSLTCYQSRYSSSRKKFGERHLSFCLIRNLHRAERYLRLYLHDDSVTAITLTRKREIEGRPRENATKI